MRAFWYLPAAFLAACGYGADPMVANTPPPPPPLANDITIVTGASTKGSAAFSPNPKTVALAGETSVSVRWVNGDVSGSDYNGNRTAVTHHIRSDDGTSFDTGDLAGNATFSKSLAAGTYPYHCTLHPTMTGTVVVNP